MRRNENTETRMVVRERERESKRVRKTCSLFDAQKAELKKYRIERTGYREKLKEANFTAGFNKNSKKKNSRKISCESKIAEDDFFRDVDVNGRRAKAFTENNPSFLCALINRELASERGITLLSLIITVVIMIILAAVTINITLGDGGLIWQAQHAAEVTVNSAQSEQEQLDSLEKELANILAENEGPTPIPETETQVANYADVDGNGTVDGVIYADLAIGGSGTGLGQSYTIPTSSGFKKYEVTQESYSGSFGTGKVIAPVKGSSGNERFYVMALTDVDGQQNGTTYCWYDAANGWMNDYARQTSTEFGQGEQNTINMIAKWNSSGYGAQNDNNNYDDMWGISAVNSRTWNGASGWYVPSRDEWAAFMGQLNITTSNYSSKGLSKYYWLSSQSYTDQAWDVSLLFDKFNDFHIVTNDFYVRLGTTF